MTVGGSEAGILCVCGVLVAGWLGTIGAASSVADTAEDQFLSDLLQPRMVHPPLTPTALVNMGHQACSDIANGVSPDVERDNLQMSLLNRGVAASRADVGTLVHFALRDLCPSVPNTSGI